jgi:DMSO/TMAO reductase YedYZ molybdopterin-dependent catalytic subunit
MKKTGSVMLPFVAMVFSFGACGRGQTQMAGPMAEHARAKAVPSTTLNVTVAGKATTFTVSELGAMPQKTVTARNAHSNADETYTGVLLTDVLAKAGAGDGALGKALLRSYVKAMGTDQYWVLYSGIEIDPASHAGQVIVATMVGGKALGEDGAFRLVSSEDGKPQRWVRNLTGLTLVKAE